jgi:hypothetical protein
MNRKQMSELLDEHLRSVNVYFDRESEFPKGRGPLKTYIIEAHSPDGDCLCDGEAADVLHHVGKQEGLLVDRTDDQNLFEVRTPDAGFFFDVLDPRFWVVHTMSNVDVAESTLSALIAKYPYIDNAWPPADMMRDIQGSGKSLGFTIDFDHTRLSQLSAEPELMREPDAVVKIRFGGTGADALVNKLNEVVPHAMTFSMVKFSREELTTGSYLISELDARGRLKAAGNSVSLHLQTVSSFLHEYKSFILEIEEASRITAERNGHLAGTPIVLDFPKPLNDFKGFVKSLISCREPLKIWGLVNQIREDYVQIDGVDLHSGSRLTIDATKSYLRLYLGPHSCGNTIARLLRNLQAHVGSDITLWLPGPEHEELAS